MLKMLEIIFMNDWIHAAQRLNRLPPLFEIGYFELTHFRVEIFTPALFLFPINVVTKAGF